MLTTVYIFTELNYILSSLIIILNYEQSINVGDVNQLIHVNL
jgi:hypothetical protein